MATKWLKKGKAAQKSMKEEEARAEAQKNMGGNNRFWMKEGEERTITFVDGGLTEDGLLDIPMYFEHTVKYSGQWTQFVCVAEEEPCPLCETGDRPTFVGVATIIDHTGFYSKKDEKQIKNIRRLYVAPRTVIKKLQTLAAKRGTLAGLTFDVTRTEKKAARVGDLLDCQGITTLKDLKKHFPEAAVPFNYEEELPHVSADELRKMGFGGTKLGGESEVSDDDGDSGGGDLPWKSSSDVADQL